MKTLEEVKDEVAQSKNWTNWKTVPKKNHDSLWPEVCKLFAKACIEDKDKEIDRLIKKLVGIP